MKTFISHEERGNHVILAYIYSMLAAAELHRQARRHAGIPSDLARLLSGPATSDPSAALSKQVPPMLEGFLWATGYSGSSTHLHRCDICVQGSAENCQVNGSGSLAPAEFANDCCSLKIISVHIDAAGNAILQARRFNPPGLRPMTASERAEQIRRDCVGGRVADATVRGILHAG